MPPLNLLLTPPVGLAAAAVWCSLLQLVLARWRDLGGVTTGLVALALFSALPQPSSEVLGLIAAAMLLASMGWARGGARGVGRPGLTGLVLGVSAALMALERPMEQELGLPGDQWRLGSLFAVALLTLLVGVMALLRARPGYPPPRWFGEIPVRGGPDRKGDSAPKGEHQPKPSAERGAP